MQLLAISGDFQDPRACHSFATVFLKAQALRGHTMAEQMASRTAKTSLTPQKFSLESVQRVGIYL